MYFILKPLFVLCFIDEFYLKNKNNNSFNKIILSLENFLNVNINLFLKINYLFYVNYLLIPSNLLSNGVYSIILSSVYV